MNEILNALNNKLVVCCNICDLEKAFHCVNHDILLSKLENYGITGTDKEPYHSYLKGSYQRIHIIRHILVPFLTGHGLIMGSQSVPSWVPCRFFYT